MAIEIPPRGDDVQIYSTTKVVIDKDKGFGEIICFSGEISF